jgi:hypothetical protein
MQSNSPPPALDCGAEAKRSHRFSLASPSEKQDEKLGCAVLKHMKSSSACLRLTTDQIDVGFIETAFGRTPSRTRLKGTRMSPSNPSSAIFEQTLCIFESGLPDSREPHEHLEAIVHLLESRIDEWKGIRNRITEADIFCGFSSDSGQGSFEIRADLLERLAKQHVDFILDLYPPVPDSRN